MGNSSKANSATTLVSFIGNPSRSRATAAAAPTPGGVAATTADGPRTPASIAEYESTPYRFEDGFVVHTLFFGWAALQHLRHRASVERRPELSPARWLVIGTPSSAWHMMAEVAIDASEAIFDAAAEWSARARASWQSARDRQTPAADAAELRALLDEFSRLFAPCLATDLRMRAIDDDADQIFASLRDEIDEGGRVILDVTHGFRTMPIHATIALGSLRWLKSIEVADVLYGGIEKKGSAPHAPAVSLGASARLARTTPALAQLALVDDVGHAAEAIEPIDPGAAARLREMQRYESLMQFGRAAGPRGQAIGRLGQLLDHRKPVDEVTRTVAASLVRTLESLAAGTGSFGLRNRAERAIGHRDFMRAIGLANEMLLLKAVELRGLHGSYDRLNTEARSEVYRQADLADAPRIASFSARSNYTTLNHLRNAVMHPDGGIADLSAPRAINSTDEMLVLLAWSLRFYDFLR